MEQRSFGARLRARRVLVLLSALIAILVALAVIYSVNSSGLHLRARSYGVGNAQLLVDSKPSTLAALTENQSAGTLSSRAPLFAEYGTGQAIKAAIASRAGVPLDSLSVLAATDQVTATTATNTAPSPATTNFVLLSATIQSSVISITSQAASAQTAERLAAATVVALRGNLNRLEAAQNLHSKYVIGKIVLRPLGSPSDATAVAHKSTKKAILLGVIAFVVLILLVLALDNFLVARRQRRTPRQPTASV